MSSFTFTRLEVQDMFDVAQLEAGVLFANIVFLRDELQTLFSENLMDCNSQDTDPMKLLLQALKIERFTLDAYNKHRLSKAVTVFNTGNQSPENVIEYNEKDNIPEKLEWFPLRAEVARRGMEYTAQPIYQLRVTEKESAARLKTIPEKTANGRSSAKGKRSTGFGSSSYDKLRDAPSPWLDLPHGNLTLVEMTTLVPHAIKSYDIMDRFLYNGALSGTFATLINQYRHMPYGHIENNSIYRMMKGPMDHRAKDDPTYKKWTVAKHATIKKPGNFDPTSVSVAGFRTPLNFNSRQSAAAITQPPPSILFRDMANGVKTMPSGYDALDLTRCVEYCLKHNDESWTYPRDFEKLVAQLGGAATVYYNHQDEAAILRHTSGKKRMNAKRAGARQRNDFGHFNKQNKSFVVDSEEDEALDRESEESEEDLDDLDSDIEDDNEPATATKKDAKRKHAFKDDISNGDDFMPQIGASSKRKRTTSGDEDYEQISTRQISRRNKKLPPRTHADRSKGSSPPRFRKEVAPEGIDSGSDGDTYAGPKRRDKRAVVATRCSTRNQPFSGSYIVEKILENEEDEGEDEVEDTPTSNKQFLTSAQLRQVGRK
ncbi:hypothetical protein G6011_00507 [Alternaria panax]|uniref:Uncharacterized protein n=1 Tax=Alternaria panax TaxID=48097 RepID=A0AAD4II96_9PLEO|nr:hypothetical protein G6011_00507 [Alternaria panax]